MLSFSNPYLLIGLFCSDCYLLRPLNRSFSLFVVDKVCEEVWPFREWFLKTRSRTNHVPKHENSILLVFHFVWGHLNVRKYVHPRVNKLSRNRDQIVFDSISLYFQNSEWGPTKTRWTSPGLACRWGTWLITTTKGWTVVLPLVGEWRDILQPQPHQDQREQLTHLSLSQGWLVIPSS